MVRRPGALVDAKKLPGRPLEAEEGSGLEEEDVGSAGSPVLSRGGARGDSSLEGNWAVGRPSPEGLMWEAAGLGWDEGASSQCAPSLRQREGQRHRQAARDTQRETQ